MNRIVAVQKYKDYLLLKNYSQATNRSYLFAINRFFDFCQQTKGTYSNISEYGRAYLIHRFSHGIAWTSVNVDYSAIRILVTHVFNIEWDYKFIPRPRGRRSMPTVLSKLQVERMINLTMNLKHKTIILLFYTAGIRISELVNMDIAEILFDRMQLKVKLGKGGKDRIVSIPQITIDLIGVYRQKYKPKIFLFEGHQKSNRYSRSSIHKIIRRAALIALVPFEVTSHSLRYAYATHHIENGTDLVTLQSQLGHSNIQTTIKYVKLCQIENRHLNHPVTALNIEMPQSII